MGFLLFLAFPVYLRVYYDYKCQMPFQVKKDPGIFNYHNTIWHCIYYLLLSEERESLPEKRKKLEIQRVKTAYAQKELHITSLPHNLTEF